MERTAALALARAAGTKNSKRKKRRWR